MRRFGFAIGCLVAVLVAIEAGIALADTTLNETDDTWLRQKYPTTYYYPTPPSRCGPRTRRGKATGGMVICSSTLAP